MGHSTGMQLIVLLIAESFKTDQGPQGAIVTKERKLNTIIFNGVMLIFFLIRLLLHLRHFSTTSQSFVFIRLFIRKNKKVTKCKVRRINQIGLIAALVQSLDN